MGRSTDILLESLLSHIEAGEVIPIIGPDLLTVTENGAETTYNRLLARRLAEELAVEKGAPPRPLPTNCSLNEVICAYQPLLPSRQSLYAYLHALVRENPVAIPEPLAQLARITDFRLLVSTSFEGLLVQAVNQERFGGRSGATVLAYSPNNVPDLPEGGIGSSGTVVFQLMGQVGADPTKYAVTEGDQLEFIHQLQAAKLRPQRLLDEFHQRHLLLLGNGFCDGLGRFFLRLAQGEPFWKSRGTSRVITDAVQDDRLVTFINHFSRETTVVREFPPVEFVRELSRRWEQRRPVAPANGPIGAPSARSEATPQGGVFLSYAHEDAGAARALQARLLAHGVETWLDESELKGGDEWERVIRQRIKRCELFLPLISRNTESRTEGYFRKEWAWGIERLPTFTGANRRFIVPVVVDELRQGQAKKVPEAFGTFQWETAPGGEATPEFLARMKSAIRELRVG